MNKFGRKKVWQRARGKCEYCQLPQEFSVLPHEIDHIRARKHRGATTLENTCLACAYCNGAKGSNVAGYDPDTDELVPLFNPRSDEWQSHFRWDGAVLVGKTPIGRATIEVLRINDAARVETRQLLNASGEFGE
jgi:5-methylcytosine-specific restriction endonuclease McrA